MMTRMLTKEEVRAAIQFRTPPRPPRAFTKWWGERLCEQYGEALSAFDAYEEDVVYLEFPWPAYEKTENGFYWRLPEPQNDSKNQGLDAKAFLIGMDVQDTLINGTPEEVRQEVRLMRDTFDSPAGGFIYAAGNGIVRGTPLENIEAFLNEIITYRNEL